MTSVRDEDLVDFLDALDVPPCPRCGSSVYEHDAEFRAYVCNDCGLWLDDEE